MKGWGRGIGRAAALLVTLCAVAGGSAVEAGAATWEGRQIAANEAVRLPLFSVSCPTTSLCVAVGGGNTIASSTNPTGGSGDWKVVYAGSGTGEPNQKQIRGISCPSPQLCVAVTFEGLVYTSTDPAGGAWQVADLAAEGPNLHLYGVSCPTVSFCAVSAGDAKLVTSTNPTGGAGAWATTQLAGPLELRGISCTSPSFCVAVGDNGDNIRPEVTNEARLLTSSNPLAGAWSTTSLPGRQNLFGVSCPATALCVSGDTRGDLLAATDPGGGAGAWRAIDGGGSVQITDVDCVSPSLCLAIDNNGDILTSTRPDGEARDWTFTNVLPYPGVEGSAANHLFGASCPSPALCVVSANGGQIFTSTDPFETTPQGPTGKPGQKEKGGKRPRPKRPRVTLAAAPPPGVEIPNGRRKLTIQYRFFANGRAQVRGFVCKLDRRPAKRCRSPKAYRVGLGRHVFRVRAVGWTGQLGKVEVHRFKTCRPTAYPNCIKRLPPPEGRPPS